MNQGSIFLLPTRLFLFALFQFVIAGVLALCGVQGPWKASAGWWMISVSLANLATLGLLHALMRREGKSLFDLYRPGPHVVWKEILWTLGLFILAGPISYLPNIALAQWIFGGTRATYDLMFPPVPFAVSLASLAAMPITQGLAELPFYAGFCRPRLEARLGMVPAVLLAALFLAAQHMAAPLHFNAKYLLYRFLMFLPFALYAISILRWRPQLLPYFMAGHVLIDISAAAVPFMPPPP